ncbi:hypothetical protein F8271_30480 [Micromonospora sp. ALFpr18c]|uniref:hypothetical protein n=1 Tax=unclassified Micromonospora TaxID=2617518 RepID=UPI00124B3441|nr:hypothetical protein [Micromonospora sp. ALFpr18c]KAB1925181.1 hypothetical protein F8271_30480 [Micromonospora sp. ALFpr18c]
MGSVIFGVTLLIGCEAELTQSIGSVGFGVHVAWSSSSQANVRDLMIDQCRPEKVLADGGWRVARRLTAGLYFLLIAWRA